MSFQSRDAGSLSRARPSWRQWPLRPPSFSSKAQRFDLHAPVGRLYMSYTVSSATLAAVSASISTPVGP